MKDIPVISCSFLDERSLYLAYMPFVIGGGLFIRTHQLHPLDTPIKLIVNLMSEPEPYHVQGKVVWVTPMAALANKPTGIGVQLVEKDNHMTLNAKIEGYLENRTNLSPFRDTL